MIKYYFVGEAHGTNECPKACLDIIVKNNLEQLALEFGYHLQPEIEEFLADKRSVDDLSVFDNPRDTRASIAMKELLLVARDTEMNIFLIDDYTGSPDREQIMADELKKIEGRVAVFCGASHASKKPLKFDDDSQFYAFFEDGIMTPCASLLPSEQVCSYVIHAVNGGRVWDGKEKVIPKHLTLGRKVKKLPAIVKTRSLRYDYFYLVDKFTPSKNYFLSKETE